MIDENQRWLDETAATGRERDRQREPHRHPRCVAASKEPTMKRELKIHVDPQDIRVPEEGDFTADDQIKELIAQALVMGQTGGQAFGLLIAAMGTFAALSDCQLTLLKVAIDCLTADLAEQQNPGIVALLEETPTDEPPDGWQERAIARFDAIDKERNKP